MLWKHIIFITERAAALRHMAEAGRRHPGCRRRHHRRGLALDAAARGYRVGLLDKGDFASGTSSKSTKLVHGGIRYLPQFDFALVHEALVERGLLVRNAPFLVQPIGFVLPLYAENKRPLGTPIVPPFGIGMGYMLHSRPAAVRPAVGAAGRAAATATWARAALRAWRPACKTEGLMDAFIYYDAPDRRYPADRDRDSHRRPPRRLVANYAEVTGFSRRRAGSSPPQVRDHLGGADADHPGRHRDQRRGRLRRAHRGAGRRRVAGPDRAGQRRPPDRAARRAQMGEHAVVLPETEDGRLLFLVPWGPRVTIGTTDTPGGDVDHPVAEPRTWIICCATSTAI